jgi:hypothetical protein
MRTWHLVVALFAGFIQPTEVLAGGEFVIEPCLEPLAIVHVDAEDGTVEDRVMLCRESIDTVLFLRREAAAAGPRPAIGLRRSDDGVEIRFAAEDAVTPMLRLDADTPELRVAFMEPELTLGLRLETQPRTEDPLVWPLRFRVEDRPVAAIVAAIAETTGQRLDGADWLCEVPVSLHFERDPPPVRGVLLLLAAECGVGLEFPEPGVIRVVPAEPFE